MEQCTRLYDQTSGVDLGMTDHLIRRQPKPPASLSPAGDMRTTHSPPRHWRPTRVGLHTIRATRSFSDRRWIGRYFISRSGENGGTRLAPRSVLLRGLNVPIKIDPQLGGLSAYYEIVGAGVYGAPPGPGSVIVDVGANIGIFCVWAVTHAGPTGRLIALEPHPAVFGLLNETLAPVRCHWAARNVAASNQRGTAVLSSPPGRIGESSLLERRHGERSDVETWPLDDLARDMNIDFVDLMKIDVEGWERQVLQGSTHLLRRTKRIVIETENETLQEVEGLLRQAGFDHFDLLAGLWRKPSLGVLSACRNADRSGAGNGPEKGFAGL